MLHLHEDQWSLPVRVLDNEDARLAVHVQSHGAFHRAALRLLGAPSRLTPWSTANRIVAEGSPSSLLRLSATSGRATVLLTHRCASPSLGCRRWLAPDSVDRKNSSGRALLHKRFQARSRRTDVCGGAQEHWHGH